MGSRGNEDRPCSVRAFVASRRKGDLPAWLNKYEDQDLRCLE